MVVSEYFSDEELSSQLRMFFDAEEQYDVDFRIFFNQIEERESDYYLEIRGKQFSIDKITGSVTLLNPTEEDEYWEQEEVNEYD